MNQAGTTARVGRGDYFVVEADESDRSFLMFAPVVAVVTTIDREHLDQYSSLEDIQDAFLQFVNRVPFYGAAILVPGRAKCAGHHSECETADYHVRNIDAGGLGDQ